MFSLEFMKTFESRITTLPRIGVLGGMGPLATADFMAKLVYATPVAHAQDHFPVSVDSTPQIPDRVAALEGLKMMAMSGHGVAFLPESAVAAEVRGRKLACAGAQWSVEMEIRLYREKPGPGRPGKGAALALWEHLIEAAKVMPKKHKVMKT